MDYYRSLDASALDPDIPTVFELFAAKQLNDLINPYVRYILVHYAQSHPQYLLRIVQRYDELFLLIFGAVEYAHLKHYNSTFVEKFYGLKRVNRLPVQLPRTSKNASSQVDALRRLTTRQVLLSLAATVGVPYLISKAEVRYERLVSRYSFRSIESDLPADDAPLLDHWRYQADVALLKWYPRLSFLSNTTDLGLCLMYLFSGTGPFSLSDWLINTRYSRLSMDEIINAGGDAAGKSSGIGKVVRSGLQALGYVLPTALFTIKFLEWWNNHELSKNLAFIGPELPPPEQAPITKEAEEKAKGAESRTTEGKSAPKAGTSEAGTVSSEKSAWNGCPICHRRDLQTPSVLETGVVFCYKCIWDHLQDLPSDTTPRCPVTGIELLLTEWNSTAGQWDIGGIRRLML